MPASTFFAIIFFLMLITLGLDSTESKQVETKADAKNGEERGRDASKKPLGSRRDADLGKEPKRGGLKKSFSRDKDEADGKGGDKPKEEKLIRGIDRGRDLRAGLWF